MPVVSGRAAIEAFERVGCEIDHQTGSHVILRQVVSPHRRLTVSNHRELARGTLCSLIRQAGLTVDEFWALL
jgi:predicted RNA binding protein YcfA (HicA-like mRNA interferase family)